VFVLLLALTIRSEWHTLTTSLVNWSSLNFLVQLGIVLVLFWKVRRFRRWIMDTIGERPPIQRRWYQFLLPALFAMPFVFYVLLSGVKRSVTPVMDFSLIAIAPILGGLMLTAAGSKRIRRVVRLELISVAQKLIVATVLLIVFTALFFTLDLVGDIDPKSLEWSSMGFIRWAFFWGNVWSFYPGVYLFLLGVSDLVFTLRHLRR